jgi:hypothetical protein
VISLATICPERYYKKELEPEYQRVIRG